MLRYARKDLADADGHGDPADRPAGRRTPDRRQSIRADLLGGHASRHTLWFILLTILWVGFFVLEGFDFGVGMLHTIVGKTDTEQRDRDQHDRSLVGRQRGLADRRRRGHLRRLPRLVRDDVLGRCTCALLLILVALMARGVAFEFRNKTQDPRWRTVWRWCLTIGSLLIPLLLGVGLGDLLAGLPINSAPQLHGQLLRPADPVRPAGPA